MSKEIFAEFEKRYGYNPSHLPRKILADDQPLMSIKFPGGLRVLTDGKQIFDFDTPGKLRNAIKYATASAKCADECAALREEIAALRQQVEEIAQLRQQVEELQLRPPEGGELYLAAKKRFDDAKK